MLNKLQEYTWFIAFLDLGLQKTGQRLTFQLGSE
jgi:hypothetical protein